MFLHANGSFSFELLNFWGQRVHSGDRVIPSPGTILIRRLRFEQGGSCDGGVCRCSADLGVRCEEGYGRGIEENPTRLHDTKGAGIKGKSYAGDGHGGLTGERHRRMIGKRTGTANATGTPTGFF